MASQFIRFETYGMSPGRFRKAHETAWGVLAESARVLENSRHIRRPVAPTVVHGVMPTEIADRLDHIVRDARDRRGAKLRPSSKILYAVVASFPTAWRNLETGQAREQYLAWRTSTTRWLIGQFGDQLASVVEHVDETYPHIHALALPLLDDRNRLDHSLHPGYAARKLVAITGASSTDCERAYRSGMRSWQDAYHQAVSKGFGHSRVGPRRQRFRRDTALVRQSLDHVLHIAGRLSANMLALASEQASGLGNDGDTECLLALSKLIDETRAHLLNGRNDALDALDAALTHIETRRGNLIASSTSMSRVAGKPYSGEETDSDDDLGPERYDEFDVDHDDDPTSEDGIGGEDGFDEEFEERDGHSIEPDWEFSDD